MLMIEKLKMEVRALRAQLEDNGIKPNIGAFKMLKEEEAPPKTAMTILEEEV